MRRSLAGAILMSLLAACSSSPASTAGSSSPSPRPSPSASPAPSGYRVLIPSTSSNGSELFLYDSASSSPQQLAALPSGAPPVVRFISSGKVAYTQSSSATSTQILSMDLSTRTPASEVTASGLIPAFAYSHDGSMLAYLVHDPSGKASLHLRRNGQESTLTLNAIPGRGVTREDEVLLQYSPDDQYLLMVDTYVGNQLQAPQTGQFLVLRTSDNSVVFTPPPAISSDATMATWAAHRDRLYYRDEIGVRTWDAGATAVGTLATALHWYDPAVSPDDRYIAYTLIDTQFVPHVMLLNLQSNQSSAATSASRSHPIFITSDLLWDLEEQACQSECLAGPSQPTGKVLAYSLKSKAESALPFTDVQTLAQFDVAGR